MTDVVEVAVGEIARVAAWSLRGLGMAFGVADRAAPIVGWAEAVEGGALKTLRMGTALVSGNPPALWHRQVSQGVWTVDASGRSLLEIGPVAIDLLTLAARTGQVGRVDLANVIDSVFLSGVARIAARRQVGVIALSSGPDLTLCGTPVATLHAFPGPHGPVFDNGGIPKDDAIYRAIAAYRPQAVPSGREVATISMLSYSPADTPVPITVAPSRFDAEGKFTLAQAQGVLVDRETLAHLYQLEIRTWAPTSERSRNQAIMPVPGITVD